MAPILFGKKDGLYVYMMFSLKLENSQERLKVGGSVYASPFLYIGACLAIQAICHQKVKCVTIIKQIVPDLFMWRQSLALSCTPNVQGRPCSGQ